MAGRGSRGKPRPVRPVRVEPPEEATVLRETSPELLESLRDESERPTIRLPVRAPLAPIEEAEPVVAPIPAPAPPAPVLRRRVVYGPDGVPRTLYDDELEEATRPYVPPKLLLGRGKAKKKR